jgi:hypothetical protein
MNTLTGIEADRVDTIMRSALDRLRIMSYVPTTWDDNILTELRCQAVITALEKTWSAEDQLRALAEGEGMAVMAGKDLALVKQAARATRSTCRNLQADRESLQILMSRPETTADVLGGERGGGEEMARFIKYLGELTAQVHTRMTTTVEDEAANRALLHDLTEKERLMEETRDVLQVKLTEVLAEKESVTFSLDQTLRKLQLELQDITAHNNLELETVQREMSDAIAKATSDHDLRMRQLQGSLDSTERLLADMTEKNREEEQRMRKEKNRSEATLNAKIASYDEDMLSRHRMLVETEENYAKESAEYAQLKEYFDRIDADLALADEEAEVLKAVERRAAFGTKVLDGYTVLIQKIVRGKLGRIRVNKLKPKPKGGKKGKK